jgi:hypothetical protein
MKYKISKALYCYPLKMHVKKNSGEMGEPQKPCQDSWKGQAKILPK